MRLSRSGKCNHGKTVKTARITTNVAINFVELEESMLLIKVSVVLYTALRTSNAHAYRVMGLKRGEQGIERKRKHLMHPTTYTARTPSPTLCSYVKYAKFSSILFCGSQVGLMKQVSAEST